MRQSSRQTFPRTVDSDVFGRLVVHSQKDCLGKGTYGEVYKAVGADNPNLWKAIKFLNPETVLENEGIPATTLREVNAMKSIKCCNVMDLEDVVYKNGPEGFSMVMDLMRGTMVSKIQHMSTQILHNKEMYATYIPVPGGKREFTERKPTAQFPPEYLKQCKVSAWQLLNGVAACHANGVIHRDIKPANILWSKDDVMKIGDFGLARFQRGERTLSFTVPQQTGEICTLQYRAPEVLLGDESYGLRVDDWSVGCCIAEMFHLKYDPQRGGLIGTPVFSGTSELSNLIVIFDLCGTPTTKSYLHGTPWWSDAFPVYEGRLRESLPLLDDVGFDLVSRLLTIDPCARMSSRQLLNHPWFDEVMEEGLLERFTAWDADIQDKIVRMRSIIDHAPAQPSPYWEAAPSKVQRSNNVTSASSNPLSVSASHPGKARAKSNATGLPSSVTSPASPDKENCHPANSKDAHPHQIQNWSCNTGRSHELQGGAHRGPKRNRDNNTSVDYVYGDTKRVKANQMLVPGTNPYDPRSAPFPSSNNVAPMKHYPKSAQENHAAGNITGRQRGPSGSKNRQQHTGSQLAGTNAGGDPSSRKNPAAGVNSNYYHPPNAQGYHANNTSTKQNRLIDDYMK